ncbi:CD109 antigen-like [Tropilaelaps mercedesae]|uniref:CD109 antigen-like n=1 Tax=Tropilaelaps mercedesae TaxID=418985 RepID=A0A1V9XIF6_9ACAR|nr:CD109 antigen-like [Tropilaelaps mercedesae]
MLLARDCLEDASRFQEGESSLEQSACKSSDTAPQLSAFGARNDFYGVWDFEFPIGDLLRSTKNVQRFKLVLKAKVMDARTSLVRKGYSESLIFRKSYTLRFEGPPKQVFKPGLPFRAYIELRYQDGTPVEPEWFRGRPVSHYLRVTIFVPSLAAQPKLQHPRILLMAGTRWEVQIDVTPNWSNSSRPIFLEAHFFDEYFGVERAKLVLVPEFSENSHHLAISTSTRNARVGEYIIFHVRANYYVESFQYLVMSKGVIIKSGVESMTSSIRTFAVTLTKDMSPRAIIVVYDLTADDKLLADSLEFPVEGVAMNKVSIQSESRDRSGSSLNLTVYADVGSVIGISSQPLDVLATYIHHPISTRKRSSPPVAITETNVAFMCGAIRRSSSHDNNAGNKMHVPVAAVGASHLRLSPSREKLLPRRAAAAARPRVCVCVFVLVEISKYRLTNDTIKNLQAGCPTIVNARLQSEVHTAVTGLTRSEESRRVTHVCHALPSVAILSGAPERYRTTDAASNCDVRTPHVWRTPWGGFHGLQVHHGAPQTTRENRRSSSVSSPGLYAQQDLSTVAASLEFTDSGSPHATQVDTHSTFQALGLSLFSDAYVGRRPRVCIVSSGYAPCFDGSCYSTSKMCNGVEDCADGADEFSCHHRHAIDWERFRRTRRNLVSSDFEATWLWKDVSISATGHSTVSMAAPSSRCPWAVSAVAVSPFRGIYTLPNPEMLTSSRPFYMTVDAPKAARLGEHFSARVALFNLGQTKLEVLVTLANSLDYKFVYVNAPLDSSSNGHHRYSRHQQYRTDEVKAQKSNSIKQLQHHQQPITMYGEHQHLVFLWPQRPVVLLFPIVGIRPGETNLTVAAKTQTMKTSMSTTIKLIVRLIGNGQNELNSGSVGRTLIEDVGVDLFSYELLETLSGTDRGLPLGVDLSNPTATESSYAKYYPTPPSRDRPEPRFPRGVGTHTNETQGPEGFEWRSRASLLVDIPRGAYVLKQLDTGITGLQQEASFGPAGRNHIPAGNYHTAEITITGSAFGPPFAVSPLTAETVFGLPGETGEANMFSFAASLLSLQLLQTNKNLVRRHRHVFQHLFLTYQTQLSYQRDNGGFAMFTHSDVPASVCCTQASPLDFSPDCPKTLYVVRRPSSRKEERLDHASSGVTAIPTLRESLLSLQPPLRLMEAMLLFISNMVVFRYVLVMWKGHTVIKRCSFNALNVGKVTNAERVPPEVECASAPRVRLLRCVIREKCLPLAACPQGEGAVESESAARVETRLTALTARYFHKANRLFPEWKNFVHVDHKVLERALAFLLASQAKNGAFHDYDGYFTYDRKMALKCTDDNHKVANVSLTAYVVIALHELRNLEGPLMVKVVPAIRLAQEYLAWSVPFISKEEDPYQLAITAYALRLISSSEAEYAFALLDRKYIQDGDMRYWSKRRFQADPSGVGSGTGGGGGLPFILDAGSQPPKVTALIRSELHAVDVETTAYALLAYLYGKAVMVKPVVEWLAQHRRHDGGWASTQDTIVAMEALLEYDKRTFSSEAEERELSMTITIEAACLPGISKQFHVSIGNRYQLQRFRIPNAWGQLTVRARGVGVALLQMALSSRHHEPPSPVSNSLSLEVKVFSSGRNHSRLHFRSCQSWLGGRGSGRVRGTAGEGVLSGLVVLEAVLPTGYGVDRDTLLQYVHSGTARNLRHAHALDEGRVAFYFDYLDSFAICINFTALRLLPTAVVSRQTLVKVYEYHEPERLNQTLVDLSFLHELQVCDVCGSYQCVECPSYNAAQGNAPKNHLSLFLFMLVAVHLLRVPPSRFSASQHQRPRLHSRGLLASNLHPDPGRGNGEVRACVFYLFVIAILSRRPCPTARSPASRHCFRRLRRPLPPAPIRHRCRLQFVASSVPEQLRRGKNPDDDV